MKRAGVTEHNFYFEEKEAGKRLLPCPFCGNTDIEFSMCHPQYWGKPDMDYWCYWNIHCWKCGADMENGKLDEQTWEDAKEEIINAWNRRDYNAG